MIENLFNIAISVVFLVFIFWFYSKLFKLLYKIVLVPFKFVKKIITAPFTFLRWMFSGSDNQTSSSSKTTKLRSKDDIKQTKKQTSSDDEEGLGFLGKVVAGYAVAKTAQIARNVANPPVVFVEVPQSIQSNYEYTITSGSQVPMKDGRGYTFYYTVTRKDLRNPRSMPIVQNKQKNIRRFNGSGDISENGCKIKYSWTRR